VFRGGCRVLRGGYRVFRGGYRVFRGGYRHSGYRCYIECLELPTSIGGK